MRISASHPLPTVKVEDTDIAANNAYYDSQRNCIVVGINVASDPDAVIHERAQHVLGTIIPESALNSWQGVKGPHAAAFTPLALQYALSDYLTCSFKNDPCLGRGIAQALGMASAYAEWTMT